MTPLDRGLGAALAVAAMAGLVWASSAPMTSHGSPDALLRLAWSARPERIETCRQQSDEELARLPQHMRQAVVCDGATAAYRLEVRYNGAVIGERVVRGGGLRQDRRLYVFEEFPLPAGEAAIAVRFERLDSGTPAVAAPENHPEATRREREANQQQRGEAVPARSSLEQRLRFSTRKVILVTYDPERRALVAVQDAPRAAR